MFSRIVISALVFLSLASCSSKPVAEKKFQSSFQLRPYQEEKLANGLTLLFVPDERLPKITLSAMVKMGSAHDPVGSEGVSSLTGRLLEDGTTLKSANQLQESIAEIGAESGIGVDEEATQVFMSSLSTQKDKMLELFAEVLLKPAFQQKEIDRRKSQTLAMMQKISENPGNYADILMGLSIYGLHPYGRLVSGTPQTVQKIQRSQLIAQYKSYFRPSKTMIAVSGDIDEAFKQKVREAFSKWKGEGAEPKPVVLTLAPSLEKTIEPTLVSKAGLKQSQLRLGHLGIMRKDPDYLAMRVASLVLGGGFESRLNQKIRDDLGLTYSIGARMQVRKEAGAFVISTFTRNEKLSEAITKIREVIADYAKDGITQKELESAQTLLISQFPGAVETPSGQAANLMTLRYFEVSDDELKNFVKNVGALTLQQVNAAIRKHVHPDRMQVLVFADQQFVLKDLQKLGTVQTMAGSAVLGF